MALGTGCGVAWLVDYVAELEDTGTTQDSGELVIGTFCDDGAQALDFCRQEFGLPRLSEEQFQAARISCEGENNEVGRRVRCYAGLVTPDNQISCTAARLACGEPE